MVWVSAIGCEEMRKNADYADAASGCATRRCRSQARDLLSQPLWRCQTKFLIYLYRVFSLAAPKRLRQQVSPKAKQRRAARASARISVICVFSHLPTANRRNPHNKFEPVSSLFIPSQNQYYNQRRESRQEKLLLSLTRFFVCSFSLRRKPK